MFLKFAVSKREHPRVETQVNSSLGHINVTKKEQRHKGTTFTWTYHIYVWFKKYFYGYFALELSLHPISDGVSIKWKETKSKMGAINIDAKIEIEILLWLLKPQLTFCLPKSEQ